MPVELPALEPQFSNREQQRDASILGMWVFLATELLIFGGIITAFLATRVFYPHDFEQDAGKLNLLIGGINTVVLIGSCLTMALAVRAAQKGNRAALLAYLAATAVLGLAFLGLKGYEYYADWRDGIVPKTSRFDPAGLEAGRLTLFMMFYFILTGLHAIHLSIGVLLVSCLFVFAAKRRLPVAGATIAQTVSLYWHFVDVIWMFLFALLYLSGHHDPSDLHF